MKPCCVVSVKDWTYNEPQSFAADDIFICESLYSSKFKFFRKLTSKKWSPLSFIGSSHQLNQVPFSRRQTPILPERNYLNKAQLNELIERARPRLEEACLKTIAPIAVEFDHGPPVKEKDVDDCEAPEEDQEAMKTAKHYEQIVLENGQLYKLGDCVYIKLKDYKEPVIVRIERIWSAEKTYWVRGSLFLRPTEFEHEPTRLFYRNEVFKEVSREAIAKVEQITPGPNGAVKCAVLNSKKFLSSRPTEIDERDFYVSEAKYSSTHKAFRKFTKAIKKIEVSTRCLDDEVYFLRGELQFRKHMSPILANMIPNYDEEVTNDAETNEMNASNDYDSDEANHDENSSNSFHLNGTVNENLDLSVSGKISKRQMSEKKKFKKAKRLKKNGFNIFSREWRKKLREAKSTLSFTEMSKEVAIKWKTLTDKERNQYEDKAKAETIKEEQRLAAEEALQQQQMPSSPQLVQANNYSQIQGTPTMMNGNQVYLQPVASKQGPVAYYQNQVAQPGGYNQAGIQEQVYQPVQSQSPQPRYEHPRQVQHKEAYIRYIANIRRQQTLGQSSGTVITPDWYNSLDIRTSKIKENKVQASASVNNWIENCSSNEVFQHLLSLRYYLLNDSININCNQVETVEQELGEIEASENNEIN